MSIDRIPIQGLIEITNVCNFNCIHCYIANSKNKRQIFLSYDIIKTAIDEVCEMGCEMITITGGECMLHPNFQEIYTYIWKKGIKVNIFTNASLITKSVISLLTKYTPNCVSVSIYGASNSTYNEITQSIGYTDVINGLRLLQRNGINLETKIIVLKQNEHEKEEMKRLARKYTSNPIRVSYDLMPTYDHSLDVLNNHSHYQSSTTLKNNFRTNKQAFNCHAGSSFFSINYEGNVTLCSFCGFSAMNLKEYSFRDIWKSFEESINLSIPKDSQCYDCIFLNACINCPARTWMFNKKVGLYPIPQCKKIKNQIGGFFMKTRKLFSGSFVTVNNINYFRLDNGNIAVERTSKVTIVCSKDDTVELITLETASKEIKFWKINNMLYALASSSCITVPDDIKFVDVYFSNNYPEGQYVKYISSDRCGIIYVSETEISSVISHEDCYTDICFENNLFYAIAEDGKNKYHVIGESGKLLGAFPSKCKKLNNYLLFYDENKIYLDSHEFEIPDNISSVLIIQLGNFTFIKILTDNGIYLYTEKMIYLFGPIKCETLQCDAISSHSLFIYAFLNNKIIQVSYSDIINDTPEIKSIFCQKGIEQNNFKSKSGDNKMYFFSMGNILYVFDEKKSDFIPLIKNVDADTYKIHLNIEFSEFTIVAFKKEKPVYLSYYDSVYDGNEEWHWEIVTEHMLDFLFGGWEDNTYICKDISKNKFIAVTRNGKCLFREKGTNIYKKVHKKPYDHKKVYMITENDNFLLISTDGEYLSIH